VRGGGIGQRHRDMRGIVVDDRKAQTRRNTTADRILVTVIVGAADKGIPDQHDGDWVANGAVVGCGLGEGDAGPVEPKAVVEIKRERLAVAHHACGRTEREGRIEKGKGDIRVGRMWRVGTVGEGQLCRCGVDARDRQLQAGGDPRGAHVARGQRIHKGVVHQCDGLRRGDGSVVGRRLCEDRSAVAEGAIGEDQVIHIGGDVGVHTKACHGPIALHHMEPSAR